VRFARRAPARGRGPRWWRTRRAHVLWPLAVGLAFGALGQLSGLVHRHNQTAFGAHAVPARGVIDQIYGGAPSQNRRHHGRRPWRPGNVLISGTSGRLQPGHRLAGPPE